MCRRRNTKVSRFRARRACKTVLGVGRKNPTNTRVHTCAPARRFRVTGDGPNRLRGGSLNFTSIFRPVPGRRDVTRSAFSPSTAATIGRFRLRVRKNRRSSTHQSIEFYNGFTRLNWNSVDKLSIRAKLLGGRIIITAYVLIIVGVHAIRLREKRRVVALRRNEPAEFLCDADRLSWAVYENQ